MATKTPVGTGSDGKKYTVHAVRSTIRITSLRSEVHERESTLPMYLLADRRHLNLQKDGTLQTVDGQLTIKLDTA